MAYKDKEKQAEAIHNYYINHRSEICERMKLWRIKNIENRRAYAKKYREENRDKISLRNIRNREKTSIKWRKFRYGISNEQFKQLLVGANNKCQICGFVFIDDGGIQGKPHIDHDHNTKKIRGLLCAKCNKGLGQFDDNITLFEEAILYLRERS